MISNKDITILLSVKCMVLFNGNTAQELKNSNFWKRELCFLLVKG